VPYEVEDGQYEAFPLGDGEFPQDGEFADGGEDGEGLQGFEDAEVAEGTEGAEIGEGVEDFDGGLEGETGAEELNTEGAEQYDAEDGFDELDGGIDEMADIPDMPLPKPVPKPVATARTVAPKPIVQEVAPPPEEKEDEPAVAEHLKDAVEGSLRLKRMLSQDEGANGAGKRRKINGTDARPIVQAKVKQLIVRWNLQHDVVMKYTLDTLSLEELNTMLQSNFTPPKFDARRSPAEHVSKHACELRERRMCQGGRVDPVTAFRHKWSLLMEDDKKLRALSHKDLRFVLQNYNGTQPLDDVITDASYTDPEENTTEGARPDGPGVLTLCRFNRLELIDPLADSAVFGDANLTFSLNLAKHRRDLGHVGRVIATTFEEVDILRDRYKEVDRIIKQLEDHHAEVYHGIDCTRIAIDPRFEGMEGSLGAVYYNFPHSGAIQGFFDGHPIVNWRHENLMRLFFRALRSFVKPGGVVKVSSNMSAVGVRYSYIVGGATENEFRHVETVPFLEWHLHRYGRSYGDRRDAYKRPDAVNNQSYNAQRADSDMVYCFRYEPSGNPIPKQQVRYPPTLKTLSQCNEGPFSNMTPAAKQNLAERMHSRFVTEISGTHVG